MSDTYNPTVDQADVDLVADVILWELYRQGDITARDIARARETARAIIAAQRSGSYPVRGIVNDADESTSGGTQ